MLRRRESNECLPALSFDCTYVLFFSSEFKTTLWNSYLMFVWSRVPVQRGFYEGESVKGSGSLGGSTRPCF